MERIEFQIQSLLHGEVIGNDPIHCDFTLATQNELAGAASEEFRPILKKTVSYIVCAIIINEEDEVLMIQEAKKTYAGTWYLPAGRMEPGETIEEAAKREVLEETGLQFQPLSMLIVECAHGSWVRFVLIGDVVGGQLKTPAEADAESLQAMWVANVSGKTLRSQDIVPLIEHAFAYKRNRNTLTWHKPLLPILHPFNRQYLRIVTIIRKRINNNVHVLVSEKPTAHLPMCELSPTTSVYSTLKKFMQNTFPVTLPPHKPHGILAIEHSGKPKSENDGLCVTLLISVRQALEDVRLSDGFTWLEVNEAVGTNLLQRMDKNMTVLLNVIR